MVPRESTQEKIGCRSPEVVGDQTLPPPQTRQRSLGAVTCPPGGWGLVDNKRNTHTFIPEATCVMYVVKPTSVGFYAHGEARTQIYDEIFFTKFTTLRLTNALRTDFAHKQVRLAMASSWGREERSLHETAARTEVGR
jgi:hypothetical protein